jgi:hypothetical protein
MRGVAGEQAPAREDGLQGGLDLLEGAGDAQLHGARLAGDAAAGRV